MSLTWLPTRDDRIAFAMRSAADSILDVAHLVPHWVPDPAPDTPPPPYWFFTERDVPSLWPVDTPTAFVCPALVTFGHTLKDGSPDPLFRLAVSAAPTYWEQDWVTFTGEQVLQWADIVLAYRVQTTPDTDPS